MSGVFQNLTKEELEKWKDFQKLHPEDQLEGTFAGENQILEIDGVKYTFHGCPPGTFTMGEDSRAHQVTLTKGFWMLETEVTQEMWESVMGSNPSWFKGESLPVERVMDRLPEFYPETSKFSPNGHDVSFAE